MTAPALPPVPVSGRAALRPPGLLAPFADAGILDAADVHAGGTLCRLAGDADDGPVALAAALVVRALRFGSVRIDLETAAETTLADVEILGGDAADVEAFDPASLPWPEPEEWVTAVAAAHGVAVGEDDEQVAALRLVGDSLALDRYWRHERTIAADLAFRSAAGGGRADVDLLRDGLDRLFPIDAGSVDPIEPDLQRVAAARAVLDRFCVIAGGPGTGKTTTVARVLALMHEQAAARDRDLRVALAAPTGKAAARLQEAIDAETARLEADGRIEPVIAARLRSAASATTLHRLLGARPSEPTRFTHRRENPLPHHVVVVDETSMVSLAHMAALLEAIRPQARVVLVGDPGQLASVAAGAVLGDIVGPAADELRMTSEHRARLTEVSGVDVPATTSGAGSIGDGVIVLRRNHRFGSTIGALADAIRAGAADDAVDALRHGGPAIEWVEVDLGERSDAAAQATERLVDVAAARAGALMASARVGDVADSLAALAEHQILCAHRRGTAGVGGIRRAIERRLAATEADFAWDHAFCGQPVLVTRNDRALELFNGDTGVVVEIDGRRRAAFERADGALLVSPSRIESESMYAMTIHKSQGSQFRAVTLVLPPEDSPILTRELLYTAVTRAENQVTVLGTESTIRAGIERRVLRASGLRDRLWFTPS